jgi:hypothetical protein
MPGLASLLSRRTMNPRAGGAAAMRRNRPSPYRPLPFRPGGYNRGQGGPIIPPGGKHGGQVKGYQMGGRTRNIMNPRAIGEARRREYKNWMAFNNPLAPTGPGGTGQLQGPVNYPPPGGWQVGGPVGASPEEVAMASEIFARATPEQQDQITGGGGPGMMDEEAAIGEALAMAMGGGGGGPLMNGGGPPMGGPPMGGPPMGGPPMGGLI